MRQGSSGKVLAVKRMFSGAKARVEFDRICGTTQVVPCYKAELIQNCPEQAADKA
jgi:hypothetical protein